MSRKIKIKEHLTDEEILEKIRSVKGFWRVQRWMVIYQAKIEGGRAEDIAKRFNISKATVNCLTSAYNRLGVAGVDTIGKDRRQRAYLSIKEEADFLKPFFLLASKGGLTTIRKIHIAFEKKVGKKVHINTIYRLLARNGWRKIEPRPSHPKADKKKQEAFKKKLQK